MEITLKAIFFPVPAEFTARSISPPFRNDFGSRQKERFFEQLANVPRVGKQDKIDAFETKTLFGGAEFPPRDALHVLRSEAGEQSVGSRRFVPSSAWRLWNYG